MENKLNSEFESNRTKCSYKLNCEVKKATKSLKAATQLGIKVFENPQLQNLENKDAILVMSFGTTFKETRKVTIDAIVDAIKEKHPGVKVVTAFTSHIVIARINQNEGYKYPTPEEALEELKANGYTRVAMTQLCLIPGIENDYEYEVFKTYKSSFKKLSFGTPLMYWMGQEGQEDDVLQTLEAFKTQLPVIKDDEAVLAMVHGTPHPSNAYYSVLQSRIDKMKLSNVFFYSVEGWPNLDTVISILKEKKLKKVTLMPMMVVSGDHANNDMAGDEPDSHKTILEKDGFEVSTYMHGLGENKAIRKIFVSRANDAWIRLQNSL